MDLTLFEASKPERATHDAAREGTGPDGNDTKGKTVEKQFDLLYSARETGERYQQQARHYRQVREAKLAQVKTRLSIKQQFGHQLIAFGRKLAQDTTPAFE
ncbi:MAG: hypothetical protein JWP00_1441 [Chloroflexi bacterium]|jgi:hypothetical protein|nr:hypothetical protein [Chloroflexota bacterium]